MIERVDFINFTVLGPAKSVKASFSASGSSVWPKGWSARVEGASVVLEGEGRRIEVPRSLCVVYHVPDAVPIATSTVTTATAGEHIPSVPSFEVIDAPTLRGKAGKK